MSQMGQMGQMGQKGLGPPASKMLLGGWLWGLHPARGVEGLWMPVCPSLPVHTRALCSVL